MKLEELVRVDEPREFLKHAPKNGPRVIVADIETFPMLSYHWRMWKQNIAPLMNVHDVTMMSYAIKWLDSPIAAYDDQRGMGVRKMRDDRRLLKNLHTILSNVDMIVAQNGKRFDLPVIKGRMAIQQMAPLPPVKVIDPMIHNKNEFAFSSNSLAFLSPKFASEEKTTHKAFPGFELWLECLADNPLAWAECETYNLTDITSLEEMYMKLRGWYTGHHNFGPYTQVEDGQHVCPNCGSTRCVSKGLTKPMVTQVGIYRRYTCKDCGRTSRGRQLIVSREHRAHILMN